MFHYGFDFLEAMRLWEQGRGPSPSWVLSLVQRLPDESLSVALANGGREWFGFTPERAVWADIFDAINVNTQATGMWAKKPPEFPPAYRPSLTKREEPTEATPAKQAPRKGSVAALYAQFNRR